MFIIIGGDGQEYGPATAEQIRAWIAAGRANLETPVKRADSGEWHRLADLPELLAAGSATSTVMADSADPHGPPLAGRWRRLLGAMVDGVIESACWLPTSTALMRTMSSMIAAHELDPPAIAAAFWDHIGLSLPYLIALLLVQAALLTWRGQSIGNLATGTRIVQVRDAATAGFLRAFLLRGALARVLRQTPLLGPIFWLVDSLFIFRADHRCLHDLIAGTKVVKT